MQPIEAIFFEPVGCLAEFPPGPFLELAFRFFGRKRRTSPSGSRSYWHLLNLMQSNGWEWQDMERKLVEAQELKAVATSNVYEDVVPALTELKSMGIKLFVASSLSSEAIRCFLGRHFLNEYFSATWSRDNAGGIKARPLEAALAGAAVIPERAMFLADTLESLSVAQSLGVQSILMMNDPDESRRLAMHNPSGGIVSLHELPDFLRLVAAENRSATGAAGFSPGGSSAV